MATLRTRAAKGSELTTAELDGNFKRTVTQKTTTYACLISDNRSVIECNHATTAFTVTLGDAATMAAAETGDYEITITNIGAAVVTVARAGSDTIDGAATSLTLNQYNSVTLAVISAGTGYLSIKNGLGGVATATELGYSSGVTSSIQTQIDTKLAATAVPGVRHFSIKGSYTSASNLLIEIIPTVGTEVDPNSEYNASTGRFTPTVAGTYFFMFTAEIRQATGSGTAQDWEVAIKENGSTTLADHEPASANFTYAEGASAALSGLFVANGSSDYISIFFDRGNSSENVNFPELNFTSFRVSD